MKNKNKIKVSIIVPVYNVESVIDRCLKSLINQTLNDIEIIVVNDGSPDNSQSIIDKYVKKDKRIKSFIKENGGLSDARNYGLDKANGEYIMFVDSDDYIDSFACEKLYCEATKSKVDILVGNYYDVRNGIIEPNICRCTETVLNGVEFIKEYFSQKNVSLMSWLLFCKRNFLINNKLKFLKGVFHEDEEFTPRAMLKANKIKFLDYKFYYYVYNNNSITKKKDKSKNITDIYMISDRLENLYNSVSDIKARKLLNDRLVYIRLLAFGMQNEYDKKNSFSRTKIFNKSVKIKNKFKTLLYIISPKFYFMILKLKRGE